MRKLLLPLVALCATVSLNAQTDLKVTLRKMHGHFMKGPVLKVDTAIKTVWISASYTGEKIEDPSSIESQIEAIPDWSKKFELTQDSAAADMRVEVSFGDLVCDNSFIDWNTAETSWYFRMRYYVPSELKITKNDGSEMFNEKLPMRAVMAEICTETAKTEAALKGLYDEPTLITDETAAEKTVELFKEKIVAEVKAHYEYCAVPYYKVFYTFFAKKDRATYPDLLAANKAFGKSRVKDVANPPIPSNNKAKLEDALGAIEALLKDETMKANNSLKYTELIPLTINLAQLQYMLGDLAKAEATLEGISNMEGEVEFRKEVSLLRDYWAE